MNVLIVEEGGNETDLYLIFVDCLMAGFEKSKDCGVALRCFCNSRSFGKYSMAGIHMERGSGSDDSGGIAAAIDEMQSRRHWVRRWLVFCSISGISGILEYHSAASIWTDVLQHLLLGNHRLGKCCRNPCKKNETAISSVFISGVDLDWKGMDMKLKKMNKKFLPDWIFAYKEASYTVEAALIMAITLFLIASLLTEAFGVHSQVVGNMVLHDALEQAGHIEDGQAIKEITEELNTDLKTYFWCENQTISITEEEERLIGSIKGERGSNISIKKFAPERFLRLLRAIGV